MCGKADSLVLKQYLSTAESLMFTQYVLYSREFNAHTICVVEQRV